MEDMLCRCAKLIKNWAMLNKTEDVEKLKAWARELERRSTRPPRLTWVQRSGSPASHGIVELLTLNNVISNQLLGVFDRVSNAMSTYEVSVLGEQPDCGFEPVVIAKTMNFVSE
jgi:hypothetical protein